jgi:hypothetical protein
LLSVCVSTQLPPHNVVPSVHPALQVCAEQTSAPLHACPQVPQFSVFSATQLPLHESVPTAQLSMLEVVAVL